MRNAPLALVLVIAGCGVPPGNGVDSTVAPDMLTGDLLVTCGDALCSFAHAGASCVNGACVMGACEPDFADCNKDPSDGCEAGDLMNNGIYCGSCSNRCGVYKLCRMGACVACGQVGGQCCNDKCENPLAMCAGDGGCVLP